MEKARPTLIYSDYTACLNERDWTRLGEFVDSDVVPNGPKLGLAFYRAMDRAVQAIIRDAATALRSVYHDSDFMGGRYRHRFTWSTSARSFGARLRRLG